MSLKPIPENERLTAGLAVLQHLHDNALELVDRFPTGTRFTPIGTDGNTVFDFIGNYCILHRSCFNARAGTSGTTSASPSGSAAIRSARPTDRRSRCAISATSCGRFFVQGPQWQATFPYLIFSTSGVAMTWTIRRWCRRSARGVRAIWSSASGSRSFWLPDRRSSTT
jgi:hypothetical protein